MGTFSFSFHWPPSGDLPSPPFSFSLKGGLGSWEALSFPRHNFQFNLDNTCSHKLLEEENNDQPWLLRKGRRVEWKSCNSFEGMEVSNDSDGRWNLREISQTLSGFVA
jgi:hypothetical protein